MKDKEYDRISQEIRDVLLFNQNKSQELIDEIKRQDSLDHIDEAEELLSEQMSFLEERDISLDTDSILEKIEMSKTKEDDTISNLSWDEIVRNARSAGCKSIKIEDILTSDEIDCANCEFNEIKDTFSKKIGLTKNDVAFISVAVVLQAIRQYLITTLTAHNNNVSAKEAEEEYKEQYDKGGKYNKTYYRASKDCILNQKFVPYDAISGSKQANIGGYNKGIAGTNHRYYTLGHDPALYSVIGTANILTNTMTIFDGRSFHIKYRPDMTGREKPYIAEEANTLKMFQKTWERIEQSCKNQLKIISRIKEGKLPDKEESDKLVESFVPYAAFLKAKRHLKSDDSKNGLPIPFLQLFSPEFTKELSEYGFDAAGIGQLLRDSGKQMFGSIIINYIIAVLHGLICKAEYQEDLKFVKVRTRKVILISNLIATTSNVALTATSAIASIYTGDSELAKSAYKYADIGGAVITMMRVFSDLPFISAVRDEFISSNMNDRLDMLMKEMDDLEKGIIGV